MSLDLLFITAGNFTIGDDGIPGNNTSVIRDGTGAVIFTFLHPADSLGFTTNTPGVNLALNLTDTLGAANFTVGGLTSAAISPESISIGSLRTTGIVTLAANGAVTEFGSDASADIVAGQVILRAGAGVGAASNAIETQTSIVEAKTDTGGITLRNLGNVMIGGTSDSAGLEVVTSGNINFSNVGTIFLSNNTGTESVRGGNISGNVTLIADGINSDILANVDNDAITAHGGNILLQAGRDIGFGIIATNFDNDVRAAGSITINAARDFLIDGFSDLASDDFGSATGGNVAITAGRDIHVRSVTGTDGSIFANGNAGADVILTTGANGTVIVDPASVAGFDQPIASNSGDVIVNADRILINATSGIGALNGQVTLDTFTTGREIILGSASDAPFVLELSDAELDRIFAPTLAIGNDLSGQITVSSAISPANASNLVLRSGGDIAVQAAITTTGSLEMRAGASVFLTSSPVITVGGSLTISVDTIGNDGGVGGVVYLGNAGVSATSIAINGAGENDTLGGFQGVDQIVHGNGGNDTIISSGEGHYFGDAGNDLMLAGLSSGLVQEVLDGGSGVDTLDTRSYTGDYIINLATGVIGFDYENFYNFENVITGDGNDQIIGTAANNVIDAGAGSDVIIGGDGADTMRGGAGDDFFYVDNAGDKAIEAVGGGSDHVLASSSYALGAGQEIERLTTNDTAGTSAINLTGNGLDQLIQGNAGANIIDGKGDADIMQGFGGNDFYYVDNAGDQVVEAVGGGTDAVYASVNYVLDAAADVEVLNTNAIGGTVAINLTGNGLAQTVNGNQGANILDGRGGADIMKGFGGNDFYYVDNTGDQVIETAGQGTDAVYSSAGYYTLAAAAVVETLNTSFTGGTDALNLRGNDFAQTVRGNSGNNNLQGGGGNDTHIGGLGRDVLNGGTGNDVFDFNTAAETGIAASTRDVITDFTHGADRIDLSTIDANGALAGDAFNYIGVAGFNHVAGELRYVQVDNVNNALDETIIEADVNGNGIADFQIALTGLIGLSAGDFVL